MSDSVRTLPVQFRAQNTALKTPRYDPAAPGKIEMASLPSSSAPPIAPFWTRFPRFFLYPFQLPALLRLLALSAVSAFAFLIAGNGIITGLVWLLCLLVFLRYGSRVLLQTSFGRLTIQRWREQFGHDDHLVYMPFKILAVLFFSTIPIIFVLFLIGFEAVFVANLLLMLILPAALMTLIITNSLLSSLNPDEIYGVAHTIGKPYLLLCVCLYCLSTSSGLLSAKLEQIALTPYTTLEAKIERLSDLTEYDRKYAEELRTAQRRLREVRSGMPLRLSLAYFGSTFISLYIMLVGFNMMGYVLFQYHRPLGLDIDEDNSETPTKKPADPANTLAQHIGTLLAEGNLTQALDIAYEAQRLDPFNPAVGESYNKLLHLAGDRDRLLPHTQKLIPLLLGNNLTEKALDALLRCQEHHPAISLLPQDLFTLAQTARKRRLPKQALQLLNGFDRQFPGHPVIPEVYFLCGQILCEDMRHDKMAGQFFTALQAKYPQHPLAAEAQRYQEVITRMQNTDQRQGR